MRAMPIAAATVCWLPGLCLAAAEAPNVEEPPTPWMAILYGVVGLAGICIVAFRNSGRTHLD